MRFFRETPIPKAKPSGSPKGHRSELVSCNETQTSETKCRDVCWSNYPACEAKRGTIPRSGGYNTTQLAAIKFPKLALGFIPVINKRLNEWTYSYEIKAGDCIRGDERFRAR